MYRIDRKTLEVELTVALNTALRANKSGFSSKNRDLVDEAYDAVVAAMIRVVDGRSVCVVRADTIRNADGWDQHGVFGEHEDWPAQLDKERHPPPPRS